MPEVQWKLQKAIKAFHGDNFDYAVSVLTEILESKTNCINIIFELGIAYANSRRYKEALAVFYCLQPYKKSDENFFYNLGLILDLQGSQRLAIDAYDSALKIQPHYIEALINKGSIYNDIKKYSLALDVLQKATQIRPDIPEGWSNLGIALNHLNLFQESLSAYREAIKLNPNYYEAWSNKSVVLNRMGLFPESYLACNQALSLKPDYVDAWCNKGNVFKRAQKIRRGYCSLR
ncbi:tetratricopeptide repeat protein [Polynucleobacter hallstattensis]|uniref:tetratricopeptide repeat protein n=1 Tax=Polynucleobacter hallstattensis TaxID=1855586 RepID=UPI001C0C9FD4|nr:tetratricopeptide repeat protein [Polynucleobacter hallstattensis]MBU3560793.1 tetratricopeptide repeat protein [Polynucleobacter hallstattensis]